MKSADIQQHQQSTNKKNGNTSRDELDGGSIDSTGGFGYNSFVLDEDDSDPEEFVNIVVNEIAPGISDDQAELLANEVKTIKRASLIPSPTDDSSDIDSVDRATLIEPPSIPSINVQNTDQMSLCGSFKGEEMTTPTTTTVKEKRFSFFKRNRASTTSSLRKRRTSDTSLLSINNRNKDNNDKFESSLNFEPSTTPIPNNNTNKNKNKVRIMELDRVSIASVPDLNDERKSRKFSRKISDMGSSQEWDNISQHNIEAFSVPNPANSLEEEKEPTGQRTSHQNANKVCIINLLFYSKLYK